MIQHRFANLEALQTHILKKIPTLYVGSRTSTVLPFEKMETEKNVEKFGLSSQLCFGDLSALPKKMFFKTPTELCVAGPVHWKEAKEYCESHGRRIMTSPTEELALCLSGVATSATGERSFAFGALKDQVLEVEYFDQNAELKKLLASNAFSSLHPTILREYQQTYLPFQKFKNAPFPRLEKATDLMAGTEGQLGVITQAVFQTVPQENDIYVLIKLPKWDENFEAHLEVFHEVQKFRGKIEACEFMDHYSLSHLPKERNPVEEGVDLVFLQMAESQFEYIFEEFLEKLTLVSSEQIFQMSSTKCRELRMDVPRYVFEHNAKNGVTKVGTDVQVSPNNFKKLLGIYQQLGLQGVPFNLFGHFGDAHLHFNLMPTPQEMPLCLDLMKSFYKDIKKLNASPFAEHGVGVLKRQYIKQYYQEIHLKVFQELKLQHDSNNIFFPGGFMSLSNF